MGKHKFSSVRHCRYCDGHADSLPKGPNGRFLPCPAAPAGDILGGSVKSDLDSILDNMIEEGTFSTFGQPCTEAGLLCHRPSSHEYGIHAGLMSKPLGDFMTNVRHVELFHEDYSFVYEFCAAMCKVYDDEVERRRVANGLLSTYFQEFITPPWGGGNFGGHMMWCGRGMKRMIHGFIIEYLPELCAAKSASGAKGTAYFTKTTLNDAFACERSVCPALLMTVAGPHLGISAVVHAAGTCVDPVVPLLPTLVLKYDKRVMTTLARALKATKLCLKDLKAFYGALSEEQPSTLETNQLLFPYPCSFMFEGRIVPFTYNETLGGKWGNKLVFRATVGSGDHSLAAGLPIVVKFAETYCVEAHECCYNFEQSAPQLYYHGMLGGGWHMVVMERLDGAAYKTKQETEIVQAQLSQVVKNLHDAGFVHGDLRANNICVVGDRVCLIDFDWTGRAGVCCYPGFMNHVDIAWAPGASDGLPLQAEHDLHMLGNLIR